MTLNEFQNTIAKNIVTVTYFSHDECKVCKVLKPKVEELVKKYDDFAFIYVNTAESVETTGQYSVFTVPTVIIFVEGKESKRFSRNFAMIELEELLDRYNKMIG